MKIALLATGGTVAMTSAPSQGATLQLQAQALASSGRYADDIEIAPRQLFQKPSASLDLTEVQAIADAATSAIADGAHGVVITHGTDTVEETAFALGLLLRTEAAVVLTCAMRTADELGADGPANIAAAVRAAASDAARGLGPLVVFGDEIHAAAWVRKHHTQRPAAFTSEPFGPVGAMAEGRVRIAMRPTPLPLPELKMVRPAPAVPILQVGMDLEPETVEAFADAPIGGLVLAAAGGGHVSERSVAALERLAARVPVVLASRTLAGDGLSQTYGYAGGEIDLIRRGLIPAGPLTPTKARVLLQLLLASDHDVRDGFAGLRAG